MRKRKWIKYIAMAAASMYLLTGVTVLADAQSVNNVITAIESIDFDDINEDQVARIREAYELLPSSEKVDVSNIDILLEAERMVKERAEAELAVQEKRATPTPTPSELSEALEPEGDENAQEEEAAESTHSTESGQSEEEKEADPTQTPSYPGEKIDPEAETSTGIEIPTKEDKGEKVGTSYTFSFSANNKGLSVVLRYTTDTDLDGLGDKPDIITLISPDGTGTDLTETSVSLKNSQMYVTLQWEQHFLQLDIANAQEGLWMLTTSHPVTFTVMEYAGEKQNLPSIEDPDDLSDSDQEIIDLPEEKAPNPIYSILMVLLFVVVVAAVFAAIQSGMFFGGDKKGGKDDKSGKGANKKRTEREKPLSRQEEYEQLKREMMLNKHAYEDPPETERPRLGKDRDEEYRKRREERLREMRERRSAYASRERRHKEAESEDREEESVKEYSADEWIRESEPPEDEDARYVPENRIWKQFEENAEKASGKEEPPEPPVETEAVEDQKYSKYMDDDMFN